jgi:hypothetical protein
MLELRFEFWFGLRAMVEYRHRVGWGLVMLASLATACGESTQVDELGTERAAVSSTLTLTVSVPAGRTADQVGLGASNSVKLGDRSILGSAARGEGEMVMPLVTNTGTGLTRLGNDAHAGDISARGPVTIGDRTLVHGFVRSGGAITLGNGSSIAGSQVPNATIASPVTRSWTVTIPSQIRPDVALEPNQQGSAAPGRYRRLVVKSGATLTLSAGTYFVETLQLEPQGTLRLAQSTSPIKIYVTSTLIHRGIIAPANASTPHPFVGYTSANPVIIEAPFHGTFVGPNANLRLASPTPHSGRFFARDIDVAVGTILQLLTPANCGDPLIQNGARCDDGNACTSGDRCQSGVCAGTPIDQTCPGDACHEPGVCDPVSATCKRVALAEGTICLDDEGTEGACLAERCITSNTGCTVPVLRQRWQTQEGGWPGPWDRSQWLSGDFDADGYPDLAMAFNENDDVSIDVHRNEQMPNLERMFDQERWSTRQGGWPGQQDWVAADFNLDGRTDLAMAWEDDDQISIVVHQSTVTPEGVNKFEHRPWQTKAGGWPGTRRWFAGDFTGDGLPDLAMTFNNGSTIATDIHPNVGGRFEGYERWPTQVPVGWPGENRWVSGDFDGNGTLDLAMAFEDNSQISIAVHLNRGGSFEVELWETGGGGWNNGAGHFVSGDFDADGDTDIAFAFYDQGEISIDLHENVGRRFQQRRFASYVGGWPSESNWVTGDFNGDGRIDLAKAFEDNDFISIDTYLTGNYVGSCAPSGIAFQGFVLSDSSLGDLEAGEAQGIANSSEDWYWTSVLEAANVPVGGSIIDPVERTFYLANTLFRRIPGPCEEERGYNHFGDPDFHDGIFYVPMSGECVPTAVLALSADLRQVLGWGTLGKGGGAWVSIHPQDGWLYTSGSAGNAPLPPGPGNNFTVVRAYDARLASLKPIPFDVRELEASLAGCLDEGPCPPTDLGYIGHARLVPVGTPPVWKDLIYDPATQTWLVNDRPGRWDDYWIQGGDISPNGVLYYVYDHPQAEFNNYTGVHVFNLAPFGASAVPSLTGITGLDAPEVVVDGDESRGYMNADFEARWDLVSSRAEELEGITVYRGTDGLTHVLAMLLSNNLFDDDVSLYHWTTNEP